MRFGIILAFIVGAAVGVAGAWFLCSLSQGSIIPAEVTKEATPSEAKTGEVAPLLSEPIVIPLDRLTPVQRSVLAAVGIEGPSMTLTPGMVTCAKDVLGMERLEEIRNGAAPLAAETVSLLPCVRR